jgi:hypothetical protein
MPQRDQAFVIPDIILLPKHATEVLLKRLLWAINHRYGGHEIVLSERRDSLPRLTSIPRVSR